MAQSYAARKASLRRRTGLSPYEQRKRNALARGKTIAEARGHADEAGERRSYRQRFGASPETIRRLRQQVVDHGFDILMALPLNPRPPTGYDYYGESRRAMASKATMMKGIRLLSAEVLRELLTLQARDWQLLAARQTGDSVEDRGGEPPYGSWTLLFDDGDEVHAGAPEGYVDWNPWWYHRSGGFR